MFQLRKCNSFLPCIYSESASEDRSLRTAALEASLREVLFQIIKFVNEKKDHIPSIPSAEGVSFPYEISIPRWACLFCLSQLIFVVISFDLFSYIFPVFSKQKYIYILFFFLELQPFFTFVPFILCTLFALILSCMKYVEHSNLSLEMLNCEASLEILHDELAFTSYHFDFLTDIPA